MANSDSLVYVSFIEDISTGQHHINVHISLKSSLKYVFNHITKGHNLKFPSHIKTVYQLKDFFESYGIFETNDWYINKTYINDDQDDDDEEDEDEYEDEEDEYDEEYDHDEEEDEDEEEYEDDDEEEDEEEDEEKEYDHDEEEDEDDDEEEYEKFSFYG